MTDWPVLLSRLQPRSFEDRFIILSIIACCLTACSRQNENVVASENKQPTKLQTPAAASSSLDVCGLLSSADFESILGEPLQNTTPSNTARGGFSVSQCFFALPTCARSLVVTVTHRGAGTDAREPRRFWHETFHGEKPNKPEQETEERKAAAQAVPGPGEEAFWLGNATTGALYALVGDSYLRVAVGGPDDQETKLRKATALAELLLKRL